VSVCSVEVHNVMSQSWPEPIGLFTFSHFDRFALWIFCIFRTLLGHFVVFTIKNVGFRNKKGFFCLNVAKKHELLNVYIQPYINLSLATTPVRVYTVMVDQLLPQTVCTCTPSIIQAQLFID
jgi:hypothetical protein